MSGSQSLPGFARWKFNQLQCMQFHRVQLYKLTAFILFQSIEISANGQKQRHYYLMYVYVSSASGPLSHGKSLVRSGHKQLLEDVQIAADAAASNGAPPLPPPDAPPPDEPSTHGPADSSSPKNAAAASGEQSAEASSSSSVPNPQGAVVEDPNQDITEQFVREATDKASAEPPVSAKDRFFECDLVIPAIALKKFKQLDSTDAVLSTHVGVLGQDECQMYKTKKKRLCTMMFGDFFTDRDSFWKHAVSQCKNQRVYGIFLFDSFDGDPTKAGPGSLLDLKYPMPFILKLSLR